MQKELKKINVLQAGLFLGVFYALMGLVIGIFYGLFIMMFGAIGAASASSMGSSGGPGGAEMIALMGGMGLMMIILIPIMSGVNGFIGGLIAALLYNLCAKWVGGIKVEVADIGPTPGEAGLTPAEVT